MQEVPRKTTHSLTVDRSTFKKTAVYGAFVCFNPATKSGGEFFIADGAKVWHLALFRTGCRFPFTRLLE